MKKLIFSLLVLFIASTVIAQPTFDLGLKAGINSSKVKLNRETFDSESIVKMHVGAFGRVGWGRIYVQPEAYFSAKGGEIKSSALETATQFNFNCIDVPVLLGVKVIKGGAANLRVMAGPVFSFMTSSDVDGDNFIDPQYYKDNYFGYQYGVGVDFLSFFLDARMEHGSNDLYYYPGENIRGKDQTFMLTLGFKIL